MIFKILEWIETINSTIDQWAIRWYRKEIHSLKERLTRVNSEINLSGLTDERSAYKRQLEGAIDKIVKEYERFMNNV